MRQVLAAVVAGVSVLAGGGPAVAAPGGCEGGVAPAGVVRNTPAEWGWYDPERLAGVATGAGVRVAVVDSGVDASHPQLRGAVAPGRDLLRGERDARSDCVGHGTGVASVIAARPEPGVSLRGLAPGVTVVPVRVSERQRIGGAESGADASPAVFAEAIAWAADPAGGDADVINLSVVLTADDPRVRAAGAGAVARGVVVVAAAGNAGEGANGTPFPAAYPGVIGVGAVSASGVRASFSQFGGFVDVVAAGDGVTVAAPGGGQVSVRGTSFAAPFVSAVAALVLQRFPGSSPEDVRRRLVATADPAPAGAVSDGYGFGLLNPYRAVSEFLGPETPGSVAPRVFPVDRAAAAQRVRRDDARGRALAVAGVVLVVVLVVSLRVRSRRGSRRSG